MAFPAKEANKYKEALNTLKSAEKVWADYDTAAQYLLNAVDGGGYSQFSVVRVRAVLTCEQQESLHIVLMEAFDEDRQLVYLQLNNKPGFNWRGENHFAGIGRDNFFLLADPSDKTDGWWIEFGPDDKEVEFEEKGVRLSWKIDQPEAGWERGDVLFQKRFIEFVRSLGVITSDGFEESPDDYEEDSDDLAE